MRGLMYLVAMLLASCGHIDYEKAPAGEFAGQLLILWVGENDSGSGDGLFVYVPVPGDELTFTRNKADASVRTITPQVMYTDGGSVPRAAQVFRGFQPWGYAPAYMVHDWIFVARKCISDGMATPAEQEIENMRFIESAEVLAEAIKTLIAEKRVSENDIAPQMISSAVAGPISRNLWRQKGACQKNRLTPEHQAKVDDYLRRLSLSRQGGFGVVPKDDGSVRVISVIQF